MQITKALVAAIVVTGLAATVPAASAKKHHKSHSMSMKKGMSGNGMSNGGMSNGSGMSNGGGMSGGGMSGGGMSNGGGMSGGGMSGSGGGMSK